MASKITTLADLTPAQRAKVLKRKAERPDHFDPLARLARIRAARKKKKTTGAAAGTLSKRNIPAFNSRARQTDEDVQAIMRQHFGRSR